MKGLGWGEGEGMDGQCEGRGSWTLLGGQGVTNGQGGWTVSGDHGNTTGV